MQGQTTSQISPPRHKIHVFPAEALRVAAGAYQGEGLREPEASAIGDVYRLRADASPLRVMIAQGDEAAYVQEGSQLGEPGDRFGQLGRYQMMAPDGDLVELFLLCHLASGGVYVLPTSPIGSQIDYTLLGIDTEVEAATLADVICVSFAAGTLITLASGLQIAVEKLKAGDMVLTRDRGPQSLRWVGQLRRRALGANAPVVISSGTLGNNADLIVSPNHRLFVYQRGEARVGPTAELLIAAKHLIDGETIYRREGGWVDYYSLVFDQHEIVYAEGIPTESLHVTDATLNVISESLADDLRARFPGLRQTAHVGVEPGQVDAALRASILRDRARDPGRSTEG